MNPYRLQALFKSLKYPVLIKKKENLLYLTGRSFMQGYLLVKPIEAKKYAKTASRNSANVVFFGDGLEKVEGIKFDRLKNIPLYLSKAHSLQLEDEFTFAEYNYIKAKCRGGQRPPVKRRPMAAPTKCRIAHVRSPVDFQRQIKEEQEIAPIKKSMQIVERVFAQVRRKLINMDNKRMRTEAELAGFIKTAGLKLGAEDIAFPPIVASGANAAIPHHVPSLKRLKAGEPIIIDFGYKYKNYCSDFTRTVFLKSAPKRLAESYNQVERAYNGSIKFIEDGLLGKSQKTVLWAGHVYQKAVDVLAEKHLDKYFIHSLGHGTGLEIHELPNLSPNSKDILQNGMVFSIEPGVYIPKVGGIRIEDLVYFKKGKVVKFINISTKLEDNIIA